MPFDCNHIPYNSLFINNGHIVLPTNNVSYFKFKMHVYILQRHTIDVWNSGTANLIERKRPLFVHCRTLSLWSVRGATVQQGFSPSSDAFPPSSCDVFPGECIYRRCHLSLFQAIVLLFVAYSCWLYRSKKKLHCIVLLQCVYLVFPYYLLFVSWR